jgi:DNA-binding MltR family transcriptional regulator
VSNRDALRRLSRQFPSEPEIRDIFLRLEHSDDLHAVITATSNLEASLERLLIAKITVSTQDMISKLFLNRGPMSDLHSKILMVHALGLIPPTIIKDLESLKAIRNVFAHSKFPVSFATPEIRTEMLMLSIPRIIKYRSKGRDTIPNDRAMFVVSVQCFIKIFDNLPRLLGNLTEETWAVLLKNFEESTSE